MSVRIPRLRSERSERIRVPNLPKKKLGGRTGKGFLPGKSYNPGAKPRR